MFPPFLGIRHSGVFPILIVCQIGFPATVLIFVSAKTERFRSKPADPGPLSCAIARSWMIVLPLAALPFSGCHLPGHDGPAPKSLVECRRLSQQGVAALDRGRQQDAEALLAKAVAACPADAEARRHYAEALWRRGAQKEAIAQLEESGRLAGDEHYSGAVWPKCIWPPASRSCLEERRAGDRPRSPPAGRWQFAAASCVPAAEPGEALTCYLRALGYAPKDRSILADVAEVYRRGNQPERSLQTLQCLADTYSPGEEPPQVEHSLGQAYVALGRYDDAVESFSLAVKRGRPTPEMFCDLGEALLAAGHLAEAAATAQQALALQPQHPPSLALLQRIQLAQRPQGTMTR